MVDRRQSSLYREFPFLTELEKRLGELGPIRVRRLSRSEVDKVRNLPQRIGLLSNIVLEPIEQPSPETGEGILILVNQVESQDSEIIPTLTQTIIYKYERENKSMRSLYTSLTGALRSIDITDMDGTTVRTAIDGVQVTLGVLVKNRVDSSAVSFIPEIKRTFNIPSLGELCGVRLISYTTDETGNTQVQLDVRSETDQGVMVTINVDGESGNVSVENPLDTITLCGYKAQVDGNGTVLQLFKEGERDFASTDVVDVTDEWGSIFIRDGKGELEDASNVVRPLVVNRTGSIVTFYLRNELNTDFLNAYIERNLAIEIPS